MKIKLLVLVLACLVPSLALAQRLTKEMIYFGCMGGIATLSGDAKAVITPTSASTSLYDPSNGGAASAFLGIHLFNYVSLQADYVWNSNHVVLVSSMNGPGATSFYRQPESVGRDKDQGITDDLPAEFESFEHRKKEEFQCFHAPR